MMKLRKKHAEEKQIAIEIPTSYLPLTAVISVSRKVEIESARRGSPSAARPTQQPQPSIAQPSEVWIESPKTVVGFGRTLSRRFNKSIRRSWSPSRRNSIIKSPEEEEEERGPSSPSSLEKVKRASKMRDWSDELDEDDICL